MPGEAIVMEAKAPTSIDTDEVIVCLEGVRYVMDHIGVAKLIPITEGSLVENNELQADVKASASTTPLTDHNIGAAIVDTASFNSSIF